MGTLFRVRLRSDLLLAVLLMGLPVLLFWRLIFAGEVLYWGTPLLQFFPWRKFAVDSYLMGQVPLWNPYLGNGAPLAANWQSAVFYPLNAIFFLFPVERAMGYSVVLHVGLAGVFMYVFGRTLGLSTFGSFIGGLVYALSGFVVSRAGFLSITSAVAWLPLILAASEAVLQRKLAGGKGKKTGHIIALGALALGLQLMAGHGQFSFYSLCAAALYTLCRGWQLAGGTERIGRAKLIQWAKACTNVSMMLALGLGIAAIQLLPTAELALNSVRAGGAARDFAMAYSLWPWQLVGLIAPDFFGNPAAGNYWGPGNYWEASGYVGILPLLLVGAGLLTPTKPLAMPKLLLLGIAVASLVLAMGRNLPIYPIVFDNIPGFGFFQAPVRFLFLYTLAAAALVGMGSDALIKRAASSGMSWLGKIALVGGIGLSVAMVTFALILGPTEGVRPTFLEALGKTGVLLALSGATILLGRRIPKRWWQLAIGTIIAVDLLLFGVALNPTTEARVYEGGDANLFQNGEGMFRIYTPDATFTDKFFTTHSFRTFGSSESGEVKRSREVLIPDTAMAYGLQESYNYDPLQVGATRDFLRTVDSSGLDPKLLGLMNVRYVLTNAVSESSALKLVVQGDNPVYENPELLPRAYVVDKIVRVASSEEALLEVQSLRFDPHRTVVLDEPQRALSLGWIDYLFPVGPSITGKVVDKPGTTIMDYAANRVIVGVEVAREGYAVLSDTYYPGWKAWVNGQPATVYRANGAFRAVRVSAGQSVVEFRYESATFKLGVLVSVLALAIAAAAALRVARGKVVS